MEIKSYHIFNAIYLWIHATELEYPRSFKNARATSLKVLVFDQWPINSHDLWYLDDIPFFSFYRLKFSSVFFSCQGRTYKIYKENSPETYSMFETSNFLFLNIFSANTTKTFNQLDALMQKALLTLILKFKKFSDVSLKSNNILTTRLSVQLCILF